MKDNINIKKEFKHQKGSLNKGVRWTLSNLKYIYFLLFLGVIYIANVQIAERKAKKINELHEEVKELNWRYMDVKSQLMYSGSYTKLEGEVEGLQLKHDDLFPRILKAKKH